VSEFIAPRSPKGADDPPVGQADPQSAADVRSAASGTEARSAASRPDARSAASRPEITLPAAALEVLHPLETVGLRRSSRAKRVGGKATTLGRLLREGFPVPRGWVLDARVFTRNVDENLPQGHDLATLIKLAGTRGGIDRSARARERLLSQPLAEEIRAALGALWTAVEDEAPWGLAVRSSGTSEDGEETSLAGLATTVLGVRGPEALERAVAQVWASAVLPRAIDYLAHAGVRDFAMAVLIQVMVPARAAGVLFTAPPPGLEGAHWAASERLINATLGLGAPVVEGARAVDTVRLAREGGAVVGEVVAEKRRALVVGEQGLEEVDVPEHLARLPALSPEALRQLADLASRLEAFERMPLDIEFAVTGQPPTPHEATTAGALDEDSDTPRDEPSVLILQARPLSGRGFPEGGDSGTVWSRANVGEALPGAATPLTWSIARTFSDKGFREAFAALGCRVPRGERLVANVQGRFYLNLSAFMRIAAQVPGLSPRALLDVSGGASDATIAALTSQTEGASRRGFFLRAPFTVPRLLAQQASLERTVAAFDVDAERARRALRELDLSLLPDDGLTHTLRSARTLLDRTGTLMLTCASGSLTSHLGLVTLLRRVASQRTSARASRSFDPSASTEEVSGFGGAEQLAQTLTGGVRELDSARPGIALAQVAEVTRNDAAAREKLLAGEVRTLAAMPEGPAKRAFEEFLEAYGDRAVREAELSTPRWQEDPETAIAMLVAAVRAPANDPEKALARARALADREFAMLETRLSKASLALVRMLVARTQRFTRLREHMRTWVTRVLGMLRVIALDVDRRLRRIDPTLPEGSVFFCTYEELTVALSSGRAEVGHVVRLRRAEHLRDAARPDPPPTFIGRPSSVTLPAVAGMRLTGLPASSGVVEGLARVIEPGAVGLEDFGAGEVLVSRTTDVGLSPLFLVAAAVVTELGGPLSHAAVVAREYGVPAVVNVPGATTAIRTGDRVRVDGDRGIVERLDGPGSIRGR
jgi:pyruvate,water dikinase